MTSRERQDLMFAKLQRRTPRKRSRAGQTLSVSMWFSSIDRSKICFAVVDTTPREPHPRGEHIFGHVTEASLIRFTHLVARTFPDAKSARRFGDPYCVPVRNIDENGWFVMIERVK